MKPDVDVVTVQQLGLAGSDDDTVLDRSLADGRVLVTHDRTTILSRVAARMKAGDPVPGVIIARLEQTSMRSRSMLSSSSSMPRSRTTGSIPSSSHSRLAGDSEGRSN